jgi:predicted Rossmann fold nucleotide-binding protein DprA/Smf involved in DNA uptake
MRRVAVVGNRKGWTYSEVKTKLKSVLLLQDDLIVSGGAEGVDTFAQMYAKENGHPIIIHYPHPQVKSPDRYHQRNRKVVDDAELILAFNRQEKGGTVYTIKYANSVKKRTHVFT